MLDGELEVVADVDEFLPAVVLTEVAVETGEEVTLVVVFDEDAWELEYKLKNSDAAVPPPHVSVGYPGQGVLHFSFEVLELDAAKVFPQKHSLY